MKASIHLSALLIGILSIAACSRSSEGDSSLNAASTASSQETKEVGKLVHSFTPILVTTVPRTLITNDGRKIDFSVAISIYDGFDTEFSPADLNLNSLESSGAKVEVTTVKRAGTVYAKKIALVTTTQPVVVTTDCVNPWPNSEIHYDPMTGTLDLPRCTSQAVFKALYDRHLNGVCTTEPLVGVDGYMITCKAAGISCDPTQNGMALIYPDGPSVGSPFLDNANGLCSFLEEKGVRLEYDARTNRDVRAIREVSTVYYSYDAGYAGFGYVAPPQN